MVEQVITTPGISLDDLAALDPDQRVEVVNGALVEDMMSPSYQHVIILRQLMRLLDPFVSTHELGQVLPDGLMYLLHVDAGGTRHARIPDLSFIRAAAIPDEFDMTKPFPGAPTLAVEIVSPSEGSERILGKMRDYFAYGTEQVWAIYPVPQQVAVYTQDTEHPHSVYGGDETIPTESLFPGLMLKVADIFAGA